MPGRDPTACLPPAGDIPARLRPLKERTSVCCQLAAALTAAEDLLPTLLDGLTADERKDPHIRIAVSDIRSRCFRLANECNSIGRPIRGSAARDGSSRDKTRTGWRGLRMHVRFMRIREAKRLDPPGSWVWFPPEWT